MARTLNTNCRLAIVVCFLLFAHASTFKFPSSKGKDITSTKDNGQPTYSADLMAQIRPLPDDQRGIYTHALQLLSSMQASPSCHRLATSTLLDSCHSIDGSKHDAEVSFEDVRSIYAAQLALCEIGSAESAIPQYCESLAPAPPSKEHRAAPFKSVRKSQLSQCLKSLESRPQWWTSYSNSRQNAMVMCQAARVDIEKDVLVKLHKSMVETDAAAHSALARATNQANAALVQLQERFALAKRTFQEQLLQHVDASTAKAQSFIERLVQSMENSVQTAMSKVISTTQEIETDTTRLSKNAHKANANMIDLQKNVGRVFQRVTEGSAELAAAQSQQADHAREMALELQGSLQNMREKEISAMLSLFHGIHNSLQSSNELVTSLHTRQNALDERLINLDRSFASFESRAETFHTAQTRQAEMQARLHNEIEIEMQVTKGLLDDITHSVKDLHATIKTTAALIGRLGSLIGSLSGATTWVPIGICASFLIFILCRFSPRYARYAIGFIICTTFLRIYGVFELSLPIYFYGYPVFPALEYDSDSLPFFSGSAIIFVIIAVAITWGFSDGLKLLRRRKLDISLDRSDVNMEKSERTRHYYIV